MEVEELQTPSPIPQIELPQQLITSEILVRLPIKSLIRFKSVSKEWKSIISSPEFSRFHLHFQRSSPNYNPKLLFLLTVPDFRDESIPWYDNFFCVFDYSSFDKVGNDLYGIGPFPDAPCGKPVRVFGCSDGLVLLGFGLDYCRYILNPATQESRKILYPNSSSLHTNCSAWGFGYVSSLDDYKIVCFSLAFDFDNADKYMYEPEAFTLPLKAGTWKQVGHFDGLYLSGSLDKCGVLVNEMSYWLLRNTHDELCIVGFDLASEEFMELEPHEWSEWEEEDGGYFLSVIEGCLCFGFFGYSGWMDISMLKDRGGSTSWVKFYQIDWDVNCLSASKFIVSINSDVGIFVDVNQDTSDTDILVGDRKQEPKHVEYYVESLVSPFGVVERDTKDDVLDL